MNDHTKHTGDFEKQHLSLSAQYRTFNNVPLGYLLAFFIPLFILALNYAFLGVHPFGPKTILISDLSGQYVDYYAALHSMLTEGQSLLYSWHAGMGLNFIGLFAYYLSSPFSLLITLFPRENLPEALGLITLLKVGSAGLAFAVLLRCLSFNHRQKNPGQKDIRPFHGHTDLWLVLLSTCYALNGYVVVYTFNLMWLDGVILLPLVLLGVERLLKHGRIFPLYLTLCVLFIANFYIAYMVGLFTFLYFLVRSASVTCPQSYRKLRGFGRCLGLFVLTAALAAGSSAWLLLPTFFSLKYSSPSLFSLSSLTSFDLNFYPWHLPAQLVPGAFETLSNAALPNIYSGLLPLFLALLWFSRRRREPVLYGLVLLFLIVSMLFSNLNIIWHAFDAPNSFPYRYSFLVSLMILLLAWRALNDIDHFKPSMVWVVWIGGLGILSAGLFSAAHPDGLPFSRTGWLSLGLFTAYAALFFIGLKKIGFRKSKHRYALALLLLILVIGEVSLHTGVVLRQLDQTYGYVTKSRYHERLQPISTLLHTLPHSGLSAPKPDYQSPTSDHQAGSDSQAHVGSFYRAERIVGRSYNDPLNLGYSGLTHFSSLANHELHETLRKLGFSVSPNGMWANYAGATPVTDALLGITYVISPTDKTPAYFLLYSQLGREQNVALYHNPWALPIAFLADRSLLELDLNSPNPFTLQNDMLNLALGLRATEQLPYFIPVQTPGYQTNNLEVSSMGSRLRFKRLDSNQEAYLEFTLTPKDLTHPVFAYLEGELVSAAVYVNDHYLGPYLDLYNRKILDVSDKNQHQLAGKPGNHREIKVKLVLKQDFVLDNAYFYEFQPTLFVDAVNKLRLNSLNDLEVGPTFIHGEVTATDNALLFTSIPYDPGWEARLDGQKLPLSKVAGSLLALEIPPGTHQISLKFIPVGLKAGLVITASSLVIALTLAILARFKKKATLVDN